MTRPRRIRLMDVEPPRLLTEAETAHLLGMSASEFSRASADLEAQRGLPRRHPVLHKRDRHAIHRWLDREFGLDSPAEERRRLALARLEDMGA